MCLCAEEALANIPEYDMSENCTCTDDAPSGSFTCEDQKRFGKCNAPFMLPESNPVAPEGGQWKAHTPTGHDAGRDVVSGCRVRRYRV